MLVLTRKVNQQIRLGNDITVTVLRVQGNTIRIGIEAPRDVRVVRAELPPLPQNENVEIVEDVQFDVELEGSGTTKLPRQPGSGSRRRGRSAPLSDFFPRTVELAVANLSV
jgi:carbon storage regulator CsrA